MVVVPLVVALALINGLAVGHVRTLLRVGPLRGTQLATLATFIRWFKPTSLASRHHRPTIPDPKLITTLRYRPLEGLLNGMDAGSNWLYRYRCWVPLKGPHQQHGNNVSVALNTRPIFQPTTSMGPVLKSQRAGALQAYVEFRFMIAKNGFAKRKNAEKRSRTSIP